MKILGHGIDVASIKRVAEAMSRQGEHFERRIFSEGERAYCRKKADPTPYFAARFAAKEAYGKALGLGIGPSGDLVEIEVVHEENGAPRLKLTGRAQEIFSEHKGKEIFISLSHDGDVAMASVILIG